MTALLERVGKPAGSGKSKDAWRPGPPQVNLLPPEIGADRAFARVKRLLLIALGGVLVVCGLMYVVAAARVTSAEDALLDANNRNVELLGEKAKYFPVTVVQQDLARSREVLEVGTSTEVLWAPYVNALTAILPADASFDDVTIESSTPMTELVAPTDALTVPGLARISFSGRALTLPNVTDLVDALNAMTGFNQATLTTAEVTGDEDSERYYTFSGTVQVTTDALAHRFAPVEEPADNDTADADGEK